MTDISKTIARVKADHADTVAVGAGSFRITTRAAKALLDAAEAGMRARDAALDEAAVMADDALQFELAAAIRSLKGAA